MEQTKKDADFVISKLYVNATESDRKIGKELGKKLFILETQDGFPIELSFEMMTDKFDLNIPTKAWMLQEYTNLITKHRISSGITGKRLEKLQENNVKLFKHYLE